MTTPSHALTQLLISLGLSAPDSFEPYAERVRDRDDVGALRCNRSGVIVLDRIDHIARDTYEGRDDLSYWQAPDREAALAGTADDDRRRAALLEADVAGKRWLDVGTGLGGILDLLRGRCAEAAAVEPQRGPRELLTRLGYGMFADLADAPGQAFDVVSSFHVLEHIPDPVAFLRHCRRALRPGGRLVVEVPHARDALLSLYQCSPFRDFTLWSEHLVLHTEDSLSRLLECAGFSDVRVDRVQRYPLANHLHWLAMAKPGGHNAWPFIGGDRLNSAYAECLAQAGLTDTLIAWASTTP